MNFKMIFYTVLFCTSILFGQVKENTFSISNNQTSMFETIKTDAYTFYDVGVNFVKSPLQFTKNDFYLTGAILGITAASFPLDEPIRNRTLKSHSKSLNDITSVTEKFGNAKYGAAMSGILYGGGLLFGDDYIRESGQMLAEALLFNGLVTTGAKMMFSRARPFTQKGSYKLELFEFDSEYRENSLPSGHTSTAFTIATVLSQRLDNTYASIALYSMASLTAFQRVYADVHWFSDTVLGAAIGTVVGLKVVNLHEESTGSSSGLKYSIYPQVQSGSYGVGFALQF